MTWRCLEATLALLAATAALSSAQQTATLPSCAPAPLSLSPCIGYVFGVASGTLDSCCSQLRTFLHAQAPCLCAASKLAPIPVGLLLGQAQGMIPNVCNLRNPCDDAASQSTAPAAATPTPSGTDTSPTATTPMAPASGKVPSAATTTPSAIPASTSPATETANTLDPDPDDDDSPSVATASGQFAPAGTGSKLPELLHAASATNSRDTAVGTLTITLFLVSVATIYV